MLKYRDSIGEGAHNEEGGVNSEEEEDGSQSEDKPMTLRLLVLFWEWESRKAKIEHEYAVAGWSVSVMPQVRADVSARMTGKHRDIIEEVITKLHFPPCPNKKKGIVGKTIGEIIHIYWQEFKHFQNKPGPFSKEFRWLTSDAREGRSHTWHEMYSLHHTMVFGFVACRLSSKVLGIGAAERSWGDVKHIKSGKRSHLGAESTEKRAVLYTTVRINEARMKREAMEKVDAPWENAMFGDDDIK